MEHTYALALKLGYTALILFGVFAFFHAGGTINVLVTAVVVTGFLYVIGDLWILPNFGSWAAGLADMVLAGLIVWATELILTGSGFSPPVLLASAVLIGIAGFFFHLYVERHIFGRRSPKMYDEES